MRAAREMPGPRARRDRPAHEPGARARARPGAPEPRRRAHRDGRPRPRGAHRRARLRARHRLQPLLRSRGHAWPCSAPASARTLVTADVTLQTWLTRADLARLDAPPARCARALAALIRHLDARAAEDLHASSAAASTRDNVAFLHDPLTVLALIDPAPLRFERCASCRPSSAACCAPSRCRRAPRLGSEMEVATAVDAPARRGGDPRAAAPAPLSPARRRPRRSGVRRVACRRRGESADGEAHAADDLRRGGRRARRAPATGSTTASASASPTSSTAALARARGRAARREDPRLPHAAAARRARGRSRRASTSSGSTGTSPATTARSTTPGRCNYIPMNFGEAPGLLPALHRPGRRRLPQDRARWTSTATSTSAAPSPTTKAITERAKVADRRDLRRRCPTSTAARRRVHVSEVDYVIDGGDGAAARARRTRRRPTSTARSRALIAAEIEDGACLQIGIGGMPNAVCALAARTPACATSASTPRCWSTA